MKKIYISGKISGIEEQARELFEKAEMMLLEQGYEVVNPMKLPHNHDKSWKNYMKEDIKALMGCDSIFVLTNCSTSSGAIIEVELAIDLGMDIIYES